MNTRINKINSQITRIVSEIISEKMSEFLDFANINFVSTSPDLSFTKIYITFPKNQNKNFIMINKKRSIIQKEFAKQINLRKTPVIEFILDEKNEQINKVEKILNEIKKHEN